VLRQDSTGVIARLTQNVVAVRPLVDVLPAPVCVRLPAAAARDPEPAELFNRVVRLAGAPQLELAPAGDTPEQTIFEQLVSSRLGAGAGFDAPPRGWRDECDAVVAGVLTAEFDGKYARGRIIAADGAPLNVYSGGRRDMRAVVLCLPCGMPAKLCERWFDALSADFFVMTWETRGLFGDIGNSAALDCDAAAQAADVFAVLDHFGVETAHLVGLCGGAVIAIQAAAGRRHRVSSLSLWHGDYELGGEAPKTTYQEDLQALLAIAADGMENAASLHRLFLDTLLSRLPERVAHLVLYPFATPELLFWYARLNGSLMRTNVSTALEHVRQACLVVTSQDDRTTHPGGSILVAGRLAGARLHIEPHGDHLSIFDAPAGLMELAKQFITADPAVRPTTGFPS